MRHLPAPGASRPSAMRQITGLELFYSCAVP